MSRPIITVCIETYNSSKTIGATLDSVAAQTFLDYEIVLSDDGSKDDTVVIVNRWKDSHPDIRMTVVAKPKNEGTVKNCNTCFRIARGELIKDLAGDDILTPDALESFYQAYQSNPDVLWHSVPKYIGDNTELTEAYRKGFDDRKMFFDRTPWQQHSYFLTSNPIIASALGLIPKKYFEEYGYCSEKYILLEDYPLYEKFSKNGIRYALLDKELCEYRVREGSVTQSCNLVYEKDKVRHFFIELFPQLLKANRKGDASNYAKYYLRKYREAKKLARKLKKQA